VRVVVRGRRLPGRDCGGYDRVHVGLQVGGSPVGLVPADSAEALWQVDVDVVDTGAVPDFRGKAVYGPRGERFLYLTWGSWDGSRFEMLRRAKIMLDDAGVTTSTAEAVATVDLTDEHGMPRCARVRPPAISWELHAAQS
jgi:hypothetical protein